MNQESAVKPHAQPMSALKQSSSSSSSNDAAEERKRAIAAKMREKLAASKPPVESVTPAQQISSSSSHQQQSKKVLSPMNTYEMSDREESDSAESESDNENDEKNSKKTIPDWALKNNLLPALEKQFLDGPARLDPDAIFHEVSSCDLEAIFGQKKKRYTKRASTGNWTKDRVTASEKLVYKRKMGFDK